MTNRELQDLLKQYPDDLPVYMSTDQDYSWGINDIFRDNCRLYTNSYDEEIEEDVECIILTI